MPSRSVLLSLFLLLACTAVAQEPSGPPPPSSRTESSGPEVLELLPDIGRIGAQVGVLGGASWNPFDVGRGLQAGGFIDLPIGRAPGGKLSYEIFLAESWAQSGAFTITQGTAQRSVRTRLRLLQVSPFGLKYTLTRLDHARLRPFVNAGVDAVVPATREEAEGAAVPEQPPELEARGIPTGQASVEIGGHAGAGFEVRLTSGLSLGFEYRFAGFQGRNTRLHTVTSALGIHW